MDWPLLIIVAVALALGFGALYLVARRLDNFGVVDVGWAAAFAPVAWGYAASGTAPLERRVLVATVATVWSLRLAVHLGRRVAQLHPVEDGRYVQLRKEWGPRLGFKMALFFQAQALTVLFFSWPVFVVCANPAGAVRGIEGIGAAVVLLGVGGEALSDRQLHRFKANPANRRRVCDVGLWHYSRHPNYFFEWLVWVGFAALALPAPLGWTALVCPAAMLYLLLCVTGIRYTEEQLERSKGEAYRAYRRRTSAFVPWFPRREMSAGSAL